MNCILILCLISLATYTSAKSFCIGCPVSLEGNELKKSEEILNNSLLKIAAGGGPSYTLVKVNSATKQVVSGSLYKFNTDLKDGHGNVKTCNVNILSQPWLENGVTVTFNCPGEEQVIRQHNP